jgi:glutamate synthase domain-containing protein 2
MIAFYTFFTVSICIVLLFIYDVVQKKHSIHRNFPVIGHLRNLLEKIGPEMRQYLVANNREELPFSRRHRSWIYASSKLQNNYTGFGSDMDLTQPGHVIILNRMMAEKPKGSKVGELQCLKVVGPNRRKPFQPKSVVNISGMSYGALSSAAVEAMNIGAKIANCYHNTGEGGFSKFHNNGADVIFQIGTGYFGVCDDLGNFDMNKLSELCEKNPNIKAIEIKLSQGAKPGKGGILPAVKMTKEIAQARGIQMGKAAVSPSTHSQFSNVSELINFIENISDVTGLPVGVKSSVGKMDDWYELAYIMKQTGKGPDFITIDGGEGGTGAAPASFTDHVSLPFNEAFTAVYKVFKTSHLEDKVVFVGSGKLGLPANAIKAFSMGCDMINVGREAMMSIGCIQAQTCHTNMCPSGVATQNKWLQRGLDSNLKSVRCANYLSQLRKEIHEMSLSCGYQHPTEINMKDVLIATGDARRYETLENTFGYSKSAKK